MAYDGSTLTALCGTDRGTGGAGSLTDFSITANSTPGAGSLVYSSSNTATPWILTLPPAPIQSLSLATCATGQFVKSLGVAGTQLTSTCETPFPTSPGGALASSDVDPTPCSAPSAYQVGLQFTGNKIAPSCAPMPSFSASASFSTGSTGALSWNGTSFAVVIPSGILGSANISITKVTSPSPWPTSSAPACSTNQGVKAVSLTSGGDLSYLCADVDVTPVLSVSRSSASPSFSPSEQCSSGDVIKGLHYVGLTLTFLCASVGSGGSGGNGNSHGDDDGESSWGDGNSKTKTTLAVAGLLGPVLAANSDCSTGQFATGLNQDASGNFGVNCASPTSMPLPSFTFSGSSSVVSITSGPSAAVSYNGTKFSIVIPSGILGAANLSSSDVSSSTCSGSTPDAYGLEVVSSQIKIRCTANPMPSYTKTASFATTSSSTGSFAYDGTKFTVVIPSGILGSTISLDPNNDSCTGTDKVSSLTLVSNVLKVVCTTDDATANFTVTATSLPYTASPAVTYTSKGNLWTFKIPGGAPGPTGSPGPSGPVGNNGADGSDGKTPIIAVATSIANGSPAVAVATSTVSSTPKYTFTFTLPTIPTGYQEMDVCVKKSDGTMYLKTACPSPTSSYYAYTVLVKP